MSPLAMKPGWAAGLKKRLTALPRCVLAHTKTLEKPGKTDKGTAERRRKGGVYIEPAEDKGASTQGKSNMRARAKVECLLDFYHHTARSINGRQHEAGMMFRNAYLVAVFGVRANDNTGGGFADFEDWMNYRSVASRRYRQAAAHLKPYHFSVVAAVCGHDERPARSRQVKQLQDGLDELADLWKIR